MSHQYDIPDENGRVPIKISAKSLTMLCRRCSAEYILKVCHGTCCRRSGSKGALISVTANEAKELHNFATIENGMIKTDGLGFCPFQDKKTLLCTLHRSGFKPIGCRVSPFTLNKNNTLIVRYRYTSMKCFKDKSDAAVEVYRAHRQSLIALFGEKEAQRIRDKLRRNRLKDFYALAHEEKVRTLRENDEKRHSSIE